MFGKLMTFLGITKTDTCVDTNDDGKIHIVTSRTQKEAEKHRKSIKKNKASKVARRRNRR